MLFSLLWACTALDALQPDTPAPRGLPTPLVGEGPALRAQARTAPSRGAWSPDPLPPHAEVAEAGRLGVVAARALPVDAPWRAELHDRLATEPRWWPVLTNDDATRCEATEAALQRTEAPADAWRTLLACDPGRLDADALPAAARAWLIREPEPLADVDRLVRHASDPYTLLARFPRHRGAIARAYTACLDDEEPLWQARCMAGLLAVDRAAAAAALAERPHLADPPATVRLATWPTAEALATALDGYGFPPAPPGAPEDLLGQLQARGRAYDTDVAWAEVLVARLLASAGIDATVDSWTGPPTETHQPLALFVHHDGLRHTLVLDLHRGGAHGPVGLVNHLADRTDRPDRFALVDHGARRWALQGPPDALEALAATGAVDWAPLPPPPPAPDDTGLP